MKSASDLKFGERVIIKKIDSSHPSSRRILEIGFTPGEQIELINASLFNDPMAFSIRGTLIALRRNEASCIKVE